MDCNTSCQHTLYWLEASQFITTNIFKNLFLKYIPHLKGDMSKAHTLKIFLLGPMLFGQGSLVQKLYKRCTDHKRFILDPKIC